MPKTKREKILVILTALSLVIGVLAMQWENIGLSELFATDSEAKELREQRDEYLSILQRRSEIQRQFAKLEAPYSVKENQTVEMAFNEQLYEICVRNQFSPQIQPPIVEVVPNVEEYGFLIQSVDTTGSNENLVRLLKELDDKGFLVRKLTVNLVTDTPNVIVKMDVARPVKLEEVKQLRPRSSRG